MHLTTDEITRLTPAERLDIIDQLWSSLKIADVQVTAAQVAELDRRMESFEEDKTQAITWSQLKAELEHRYP